MADGIPTTSNFWFSSEIGRQSVTNVRRHLSPSEPPSEFGVFSCRVIAKIWVSISIYPFYKIDIQGLENLPPSDTPAQDRDIRDSGYGWAMWMMGVDCLKRCMELVKKGTSD
ncbi:hypothetical protein F2Q70_00013626 [Brassica cretica]|uniref:Uncharacterized protein n=1 Tax=Brassica cretica TaxID=69181 RepID=A0A8S9LV81_BRACR|nr:hypothetical protein F2Q70_00013626 [Brassica cretica]